MADMTTWHTGLFSLGIFVFSFVARRALEAVFPTIRRDTPLTRAQLIWEKLVLPSVPVIVGVLIALFVKNWPYPPALTQTGPRVIYGAVCGFFCTWAYRIIKALVGQQFKIDLDKQSNPPPAMDAEKP